MPIHKTGKTLEKGCFKFGITVVGHSYTLT